MLDDATQPNPTPTPAVENYSGPEGLVIPRVPTELSPNLEEPRHEFKGLGNNSGGLTATLTPKHSVSIALFKLVFSRCQWASPRPSVSPTKPTSTNFVPGEKVLGAAFKESDFTDCNKVLGKAFRDTVDLQGENALRQVAKLCEMETHHPGCSNLSIPALEALRDKMVPLQSVPPGPPMNTSLFEHRVSWVSEVDSGMVHAIFTVQEFFQGKLTRGGSSFRTLITDGPNVTQIGKDGKNPNHVKSEDKDVESNGVANVNETRTRGLTEPTQGATNTSAQRSQARLPDLKPPGNVTWRPTLLLACAAWDHFNGTYTLRCPLPSPCSRVHIQLVHTNFTQYKVCRGFHGS